MWIAVRQRFEAFHADLLPTQAQIDDAFGKAKRVGQALERAYNGEATENPPIFLGAEYKALQDRFRRLARITALGDVDKAEAALAELMDRMDVARSTSLTPPQRYYLEAKKQIEGGNYDFAVDLPMGETPSGKRTAQKP